MPCARRWPRGRHGWPRGRHGTAFTHCHPLVASLLRAFWSAEGGEPAMLEPTLGRYRRVTAAVSRPRRRPHRPDGVLPLPTPPRLLRTRGCRLQRSPRSRGLPLGPPTARLRVSLRAAPQTSHCCRRPRRCCAPPRRAPPRPHTRPHTRPRTRPHTRPHTRPRTHALSTPQPCPPCTPHPHPGPRPRHCAAPPHAQVGAAHLCG